MSEDKEEKLIFYSEWSPLNDSAETELVKKNHGGYSLRMQDTYNTQPTLAFNKDFLEKIWFLIDRELFQEAGESERERIRRAYRNYTEVKTKYDWSKDPCGYLSNKKKEDLRDHLKKKKEEDNDK